MEGRTNFCVVMFINRAAIRYPNHVRRAFSYNNDRDENARHRFVSDRLPVYLMRCLGSRLGVEGYECRSHSLS